MSTDTPLLRIDDLRVSHGRIEALHGIALSVTRAGIVTVIGPNGAGKTTLLSALMGLLPCQGTALYDGKPLARMTIAQRVHAGLCLVPERRELFGAMSVEDNLRLGAFHRRAERGLKVESELARIHEMFPRLLERRRQLAHHLSGGERQMLALGRALMSRPRLLMLDEPSLGLAPLIVREIFTIIENLRQQGVAILLVEQNARAALRVADHAYVLESGAAALSGPAGELARDARVIESYLGASAAAPAQEPDHESPPESRQHVRHGGRHDSAGGPIFGNLPLGGLSTSG